jgi:DNA (cytosine-5)-methyltransferase 1
VNLSAVSLFAGVEGLGHAFDTAGIRVVAAVEIDLAARGVIHDQMPKTILFSDVREVTADELRLAGFDPRTGVLIAGWPCQDLSLAGRRLGLGGARSGLFWEVVRLLADLRPRWFCLENVAGLLSAVCCCPGLVAVCGDVLCCQPHPLRGGACDYSPTDGGRCMELHGGAMGAVLGALGELGYGVAYRVLDAQHFGVPQRRRRVVLVGCLGDWAAPVQVLLEPEGGEGDPATGGRAEEGAARSLTAGSGGGRYDKQPMTIVSPLLAEGAEGRGHRIDAENAAGGHLVVAPTPTNHHGRNTPDQELLVPVAFALRADPGGTGQGHDASEDGTGRGTPLVPVSVAFDWQTDGSDRTRPNISTEHTSTLGTPKRDAVATTTAVRRLTPTECERLQGFPDGWTATSWGRPQSDSARYRQLGNSVAVPVFEWVARRIVREAS